MHSKNEKNMIISASIVSVGSWNPRIFTPEWVSTNVFSMPEGDTMNIALNERQMNLTYTWKGIQLLMTDRGIEIKTDVRSMDVLIQMEKIYKHLNDVLPYTPITAVGYNLNLTLTKEEFEKTKVAEIIKPQAIDVYTSNSQTFSAVKDGAIRSFDVRISDSAAEIRCNFHYVASLKVHNSISNFKLIITELTNFLGYELSL